MAAANVPPTPKPIFEARRSCTQRDDTGASVGASPISNRRHNGAAPPVRAFGELYDETLQQRFA